MNLHKINLFIIFLITLSFYGYFIKPADWNIDSRLGLVKAIVEEKRLVIDSYHDGEFRTSDKAYVNGHYYSDKAIGASLLGVFVYLPIYGLIRQPLPTELFIMLITVLAISIPSAILAPLLYNIALRIVKEKWIALAIALSISLATPIFPYAGAFYGHSLAAVLAFSIFFLWMEVNQFNAHITPNRLFLSGFLIGFMVLTEYTTLIIAIILTGYIMHVVRSKQTSWDWKTVCLFFAGGVIPLIIFISYNWICFGSPLAIGYANENLQEFKEVHSEGLMGIGWPNPETLLYMTIHPMQGIFIQSPVLFLAIGGFIMMRRERKLRAEFIVVTSIILVYFLAVSGLKIWWGGDAFTVRHLIPILPFFGIFMIFLPRKYHLLFIGLGLISFFQMLVASATTYHPFDQYIRETLKHDFVFSWKTSLIYEEMLPKLLHHKLTYTWGRYLFGLESWYFNLTIPVIVAIGFLIVFYFISRQENKTLTHTSLFPTAKSPKVE
ncbi:MAG: hypothetical protein MUO77_13495 [Anaerolineales bacterium]|nr:hypothetical protein [Anaerolineales bacterium]